MDDEDLEWMLNEMTLTAERARDRGLTPAEFLMGLHAYAKQFAEDYSTAVEPGAASAED